MWKSPINMCNFLLFTRDSEYFGILLYLFIMGKFFFPLLLAALIGCGSPISSEDTIGWDSNRMDTNPPPPLTCEYPQMACGERTCVDVSRDRKNCGWCGTECGVWEMCLGYRCVDPTYFGFSEGDLLRGPVTYTPRKDLPRPIPVHSDGR